MAVKIKIRRDFEANWVSKDPILDTKELGLSYDGGANGTPILKLGNGTDAWSNLLPIDFGDAKTNVMNFENKSFQETGVFFQPTIMHRNENLIALKKNITINSPILDGKDGLLSKKDMTRTAMIFPRNGIIGISNKNDTGLIYEVNPEETISNSFKNREEILVTDLTTDNTKQIKYLAFKNWIPAYYNYRALMQTIVIETAIIQNGVTYPYTFVVSYSGRLPNYSQDANHETLTSILTNAANSSYSVAEGGEDKKAYAIAGTAPYSMQSRADKGITYIHRICGNGDYTPNNINIQTPAKYAALGENFSLLFRQNSSGFAYVNRANYEETIQGVVDYDAIDIAFEFQNSTDDTFGKGKNAGLQW